MQQARPLSGAAPRGQWPLQWRGRNHGGARGSGGGDNSSSLRHYGYYFGPTLNELDRVSVHR